MKNRLKIEQILCLQWLGVKPTEILRADEEYFNNIVKVQDDWEELLNKATSLIKKQERLAIRSLPFHHPAFPQSLRDIGGDCPPCIHLLGNMELLNKKAVAIVGARKAGKRGCSVAYKCAMECARNEEVVISGLALGCDAAAHQGCLAAKGKTIAIVASGLDITHPQENKPLQEMILKNEGLLLSEQVIGVKANPTRLVARNRLQAALSQKLIVAECPVQSGTMHTVRFAQKYKKQIYAGRFEHYNWDNSGNEYLLKEKIALPI